MNLVCCKKVPLPALQLVTLKLCENMPLLLVVTNIDTRIFSYICCCNCKIIRYVNVGKSFLTYCIDRLQVYTMFCLTIICKM